MGVVKVAKVLVPVGLSKINVRDPRDRRVKTAVALFENTAGEFFLFRMDRPRFRITAPLAQHF